MEWQPLNLRALWGCVGVYLTLTGLCWLRGARRWRAGMNRDYWSGVLVSGGIWLLASRQVRALGELTGATPVLLAQMWGPLPTPRRWLRLAIGLLLAFGLVQQALRPQLFKTWPDRLFPDGAVAVLEQEGPGEGVFCSYHWGGYLAFHAFQPFIHSMTTYFPAQRFQDYLALLRSPQAGSQLSATVLSGPFFTIRMARTFTPRWPVAGRRPGGLGPGLLDDTCMLFAGPAPICPFTAPCNRLSPIPLVGPADQAGREIERLAQSLGAQAPLVLQLRANWPKAKPDPSSPGLLERGHWQWIPSGEQPSWPAGACSSARPPGGQPGGSASLPQTAPGLGGRALQPGPVLGRTGSAAGPEPISGTSRKELDEALRLNPQFEPARKLRGQLQ